MRLKFTKSVVYKQAIVGGKDDGKIDPNSPKYEAGCVYEVPEKDGYAQRWLRRSVAHVTTEEVTKGKK